MHKIELKKTLLIYAAQAMSVLSSFALSLLLIRIAPKELVGQILYFLAINTIVINLVTSPLGMWLTRLSGQGKNKQEIFAVMQLWTQISTIIFLVALFSLACGYYYFGMAALYIAMGVVASSYTYEWNSNDSYVLYSVGILLLVITRLALIIASLSIWQFDMIAEIAATLSYLIALPTMFALSKLQTAEALPRTIRGNYKVGAKNSGWRLLMSMTASSLVFSGYQSLDKILIKNFGGSERVAELITTHQWSYAIVTTALQPLVAIIYPSILQGKSTIFNLDRVNYVSLIVAGMLIIFGCYILQLVVSSFIPESYVNNDWWLWFGMVSGVLFMVGQILSIKFSKEGLEFRHLISVMIPAAITAPIMFMLVKNFDVAGAIFSGFIFSFLYLLVCIFLSLESK